MLRAMASREPRKPLRERVAERKAKEAEKAGLAPGDIANEDDQEGKAKAAKRQMWERIAMAGTVLQWVLSSRDTCSGSRPVQSHLAMI